MNEEERKRCRYCGSAISRGDACSWCCQKRVLIRQIQEMLRPVKERRDKGEK